MAIVDDSESVRVLMRALITLEADMELVGEAADGMDALALVARTEPDVVLLDLAMPRMDGLSVLARLHRDGARPCVVIYSCNPAIDSRRAAWQLGAADYLVKGVQPQAVIESIRRAARRAGCRPEGSPPR